MQGFTLEIDGVTYQGSVKKGQVSLKVDDNEPLYMSAISAIILGMAIVQLGDEEDDK